MKKIFIVILFLVTLNSFGQQWAEYKIDNMLTLSLPDHYDVIDTLGQHIVRAQIMNAAILIQKVANTMGPASIKEQLTAQYDGFQDGVVKSNKGKLIEKQVFEKNGLLVIQFSFTAARGEEKEIRHLLGIFLKETCYIISFWEVEALTNELKADRDKLFSSIKFPKGLSLKNQLSK